MFAYESSFERNLNHSIPISYEKVMTKIPTAYLKSACLKTLFPRLFIGLFDPSIIFGFKTCFRWGYLPESTFMSNWNLANPLSNEKVKPKTVTVGLVQNLKNTLSCRLLLS